MGKWKFKRNQWGELVKKDGTPRDPGRRSKNNEMDEAKKKRAHREAFLGDYPDTIH